MKSHKLYLWLSVSSTICYSAQPSQGPMDAECFYKENNPYKKANDLHQVRKWKDAEELYELLLQKNVGSQNDKENAQLNLAACMMAQRKASGNWASFDKLLNIPEEQQISAQKIENAKKEEKKSILIRTDKVGIGDIFHFIETARELKERTDWDVTISIPNFLKGALSGATAKYGLNMVGARDEQPKTDHTTHIIGLLGHLKMSPLALAPKDDLFIVPERARNAVNNQIAPILAQGKTIAVVFLGENRQATLIGGKQLPRDSQKHGRHLDSEPFKMLLKKHPEVVLMDCGTKDSRVAIDEGQKNQYMQIASEEQPFDTLQALALVMNVNKKIIALGADNGPTNVFARTLNKEAQRRMGFIIPNGKEYDMRMEVEGSEYTQMLSNCRVYKCETPQHQTEVIEKAFQDMTK